MIECFVFRIYPDQTDFSETSENAKCFWCSFAFLPFCPRNFANVLLDLYSERLSLTRLENVIRSCRYFYLSFPPPLQNIEPDQAMNIARSESQLWQAKGPSSGSCRSSSNCFLDFENKTTSKIKRFQLSKKNTLQTFSF